MSFAKRLATLALAVSCVISTLSFSSAAAESAIKAVDGCGVTVSAESDGTYIYGIPQKTTPDRAESLFESTVIITSENEWISTGDTLTLYENGVSVETARIIVKGDANGDGIVNAKDIIRIKKFLLDSSAANEKACDVNGDGAVTNDDLACLGTLLCASITSVTLLKGPDKTSYYYGTSFSDKGIILLAEYSDGTISPVCEGFSVEYQSGACISEGDTYVTLNYAGYSFKIDIFAEEPTNTYVLSQYENEIITITDEGEYTFLEKSDNTQIVVDATGSVTLMFVDASCTYTGADATVSILNADDVTITADGSCYIADTSANLTESAVYSDSVPLTLDCTGTLSVDGNSKEGITVSKAALIIENGNYILNTAGNGLQPKGKGTSLVINGGTFDITSGGDGIKNSKTDITINGGDFTIKAGGDGISAETMLTVNGGVFDITTSGGYESDSGNTTSSAWVYEALAEADMPTAQEEYYGLYILSSATYVEIDESNYSTYSSYTTLYDRNSSKGIKSNDTMTLSNATMTLNCLDDGIKSDTSLTVNSGNYTIYSACDGMQADTVLTVNDGTVDITLNGAFYKNSTSGKFKYSNGEYVRTSSDTGGFGGGFGGSSSTTLYALFNSGKGLKAESELYINGGSVTVDGIDDSIHCDGSVYIINGDVNVTTKDDGVHAELAAAIGSLTALNSDPTLIVNSSYEGIEGIYIDFFSGKTVINSSDDGVNAAGDLEASSQYYLSIDGEAQVIVSAEGDGLDANGYMYIYGGETYVFGPVSGGNGIIDYDAKFEVYGGKFIALGNKDMAQTATKATQYVLGFTMSSGSFSAGKYLNVTGADITVKLPKSYSSSMLVLVSSPDFTSGKTYSVSCGGTYTGGTVEYNVCAGGTYSGGSTGASITTSSTYITSNGSISSGGSNRPF
ncbi:MAG: carbohydrate-binding domain-containing protein [Clostridia bacterium]|nr:carbohydrate-binding domain-containing protein [Clostridia bacterium]